MARSLNRRVAIWAAALLAALAVASLLSLALPPVLLAADRLLTVPLTRRLAFATLRLASLCTAVSLLLGLPMAWTVRLAAEQARTTRPFAAISPFVLGVLARATGFLVVLGEFGLVNLVLQAMRIETQLPRQRTWVAELTVLGGMVQVFAPFMILALYRSMSRTPIGTVRALRSLGMSHAAIFVRVAIPLSRGGAAAGVLTVFALATGAYLTVAMLGPRRVQALASLAYDQSTALILWQVVALALGVFAILLLLLGRYLRRAPPAQRPPNSRAAAPRTSA